MINLTERQKDALRRFKFGHGRTWKACLRQSWERGTWFGVPYEDISYLQCLRTSAGFGPRGLIALRSADLLPEGAVVVAG